MCFAPQRSALFRHLNLEKWSVNCVVCTCWLGNVLRATTRAIFGHRNFQKWSETVSFWHFWLGNVLLARTACTFSTSQLAKVVREWCAFYISLGNLLRATTACNFSSLSSPDGSAPAALASLLVDPLEPQIIFKNTVNRDFPTFFAHLHLLSSHSFSCLIFSLLLFSSLTLPTCLPSILSEVISKLPSIIDNFSRMRSKGSGFTLGVWGLRVHVFARRCVCVRNHSQTSETVPNRPC